VAAPTRVSGQARDGEAIHDLRHALADRRLGSGVARAAMPSTISCATSCISVLHAAAGHRGRPDADPAGDHRGLGPYGIVLRFTVMHLAERQVRLLAGHAKRPDVDRASGGYRSRQ
jgi:hypothetical protein